MLYALWTKHILSDSLLYMLQQLSTLFSFTQFDTLSSLPPQLSPFTHLISHPNPTFNHTLVLPLSFLTLDTFHSQISVINQCPVLIHTLLHSPLFLSINFFLYIPSHILTSILLSSAHTHTKHPYLRTHTFPCRHPSSHTHHSVHLHYSHYYNCFNDMCYVISMRKQPGDKCICTNTESPVWLIPCCFVCRRSTKTLNRYMVKPALTHV